MQFGMIGWYVPLSMYPPGYGGKHDVPLPLLGLASQKTGMVLHFPCLYIDPTLSDWFVSEYKKSGKKLDMGKGCVRFSTLENLRLAVIGRAIARLPVKDYIATYQATRSQVDTGAEK